MDASIESPRADSQSPVAKARWPEPHSSPGLLTFGAHDFLDIEIPGPFVPQHCRGTIIEALEDVGNVVCYPVHIALILLLDIAG